MTLKISAYAKINLFLDIMGKRENGYHDIRSLMQTVSLFDGITLSVTDEEPQITLSCDRAGVPTDEKNLAYRAARAFYDAVGVERRTHIAIEKRIPVSAGLAGGSTDAAAVLVGLNRIYGEPLTVETLCAVGKKLGADIPFCIVGGCAEVTGIGEILVPCSDLPPLPMVVAKKGSGISTPEAYHTLDVMYNDFTGKYAGGTIDCGRYEALHSAIENGTAVDVAKNIYNVFEAAILPHHSEASALKEFFLEHRAIAAMMSGSGPSVFAIFSSETDACRAADLLNEGEETPVAFAVLPVTRENCDHRCQMTSD